MSEQWRPIPGWEDRYEVSDAGSLRSISRLQTMKNGIARTKPGMLLRPGVTQGYFTYSLWRDGRQEKMLKAHHAVLMAFVGPRPEGAIVRHLNGNPSDNRVSNLAYGTHSENELDTVRHGRHFQASKTHCKQGHPFSEQNTTLSTRGSRRCRKCASIWAHLRYLRNKGIPEAEQAPGMTAILRRTVEHRTAITRAELHAVLARLAELPDAPVQTPAAE